MAAASSEFVGGRMSLVLYYLWFCGDQCIAGSGLYCTSYLISPELDHHMRYEGEQHQNGGIPVTNLSGELRLQIRSWIAFVSARGQLGHCIIAWWCLNTWEVRFYPIVWCLLIQAVKWGEETSPVYPEAYQERRKPLSLIVTIKLTKEISVLTIYLFRMVAYICCVAYRNILWLYVYYTTILCISLWKCLKIWW